MEYRRTTTASRRAESRLSYLHISKGLIRNALGQTIVSPAKGETYKIGANAAKRERRAAFLGHIKPGVWYRLDESGDFAEAGAE
ncbi:hypothetical protein JN531_003875 [Flagellatimonas centrodinii]|uniref:hypothetical protein n=1 Tax=Flagellatimonas centrodinii TaxID=2806210 RepID=UPI001FEE3FD4|nr:hypothetical protein [Flagellatimonas centrodinii]ULQ47426.1 hypothetical protein JN531_003875 [Flagellatimonas centrodinii]